MSTATFYLLGWVNFILPILATYLVLRRVGRIVSFKNKHIKQMFFLFGGVAIFCFSVVLAFVLIASMVPEYMAAASGG